MQFLKNQGADTDDARFPDLLRSISYTDSNGEIKNVYDIFDSIFSSRKKSAAPSQEHKHEEIMDKDNSGVAYQDKKVQKLSVDHISVHENIADNNSDETTIAGDTNESP